MANKKISDLTAASSALTTKDLYEVSKIDGVGGYDSESITGEQIYEGIISQTPYILAINGVNQTFPLNTNTEIVFSGTILDNKITLNSNGFIPKETGVYQVDFTATIINDFANPTLYINFFLQIDGVDVNDSSKNMNVPGKVQVVSSQQSWLVQMVAGEELKIIGFMGDIKYYLRAESAITGVLTPSAQVIIKRIA
jgi:hypothetical protein